MKKKLVKKTDIITINVSDTNALEKILDLVAIEKAEEDSRKV